MTRPFNSYSRLLAALVISVLLLVYTLYRSTGEYAFFFLTKISIGDDSRINTPSLGRWEPSISIPFVSVAVAALPESGRILLWAGDKPHAFNSTSRGTWTAKFDPVIGQIGEVTDSNATETGHNMFCPGLSLDFGGRPVVTGGSTDNRTSAYNDRHNRWDAWSDMRVGRGYHAQVTLSSGRIFTIGGSWSGPWGVKKDGEIYEPLSGTWSWLPGCKVDALLTNDTTGDFAADNHAWLFAWKDSAVFQAGPSKAMNWYDTKRDGNTFPAGPRADDQHSMNGNAVMYDAVEGKILTLGGAPSYQDSVATSAAHLITLSNPFQRPVVETLGDMHSARAYANAVVLPTGDVFITGGASYAKQWTDVNASLVPEIWSPKSRKFTTLTPGTIPRTYHSVAVLLPDATVLTGGGGYCWLDCNGEDVNHYDIQVFIPPYLFGSDRNSLAQRPRIIETDQSMVLLGATVTVRADMKIAKFAMIRYGSATHSVNTDQRRVELQAVSSAETIDNLWNYQIAVPEDPGVMVPGYWMLFAIAHSGVPSVATTLHLRLPIQ